MDFLYEAFASDELLSKGFSLQLVCSFFNFLFFSLSFLLIFSLCACVVFSALCVCFYMHVLCFCHHGEIKFSIW